MTDLLVVGWVKDVTHRVTPLVKIMPSGMMTFSLVTPSDYFFSIGEIDTFRKSGIEGDIIREIVSIRVRDIFGACDSFRDGNITRWTDTIKEDYTSIHEI